MYFYYLKSDQNTVLCDTLVSSLIRWSNSNN